MDYTFNKTLLIILSLSSLLLSSNAVPSTRVNDFISTSVPVAAPKSFYDMYVPDDYSDPPPIDTTNVDPEILKACNGGSYAIEDCIKILSKLLEGPFDVIKALEIEVNTTGNMVKDIFHLIVMLRNDPSTDKKTMDALDVCREQYDMMLDSFNQAVEMLPRQNFVDAYHNMNNLLTYEDTCDLNWTLSAPGVLSPWDAEVLKEQIRFTVNILSSIVNNYKL